LALATLTLVGCKIFDSTCEESDRKCLANPLLAEGTGGACKRDAECKEGLFCIDDTCQATGMTKRGEKCRITAECGDEDYCGNLRECQIAGIFKQGEKCKNSGECRHGFVCEPPELSQLGILSLDDLADVSGKCQKGGDGEQGDACETLPDCVAGLYCIEVEQGSGKKVCTGLPSMKQEIPALPELWQGGKCPTVEAGDPKQAYFEVPRGGKPLDEFYALPFPNDIRLKDGHVDMSGHAVAPDSYGLPMVKRYLDVAGEDLSGFSTSPIVQFRFSHQYDEATTKCVELGTCDNMKIVDVTKSSPEYNTKASMEWKTTTGNASNYICPVWLALHRPVDSPLRPGTTYAAVLTTGITPKGGGTFDRGADFDAMLADSAPGDADLKAAWEQYKPLRDWIADTGVDPDTILNAAVFTTQQPTEIVSALREEIHADGAPTVSDLTVCSSASTKSPCEDAEGRGKCHAPNPAFTEIHGRISLPIFQKGKPPYKNPEDGGEIEQKNGKPVIQDHMDVCFAVSVPTAPAPAAGYPVLVYGHGTGGSFAGEMGSSGFASVVAGGPTPSALVAIDLPEHGERRGDSDEEPDGLFYNFLNPRAARDNVLQGAADLMSVVYWVKQGGIGAGDSPTSAAIPFDPSRIVLMGHSQGATHASLVAPNEPDIIGAVLSGIGGHLGTSMLSKTKPVDIAAAVPFGLMDPDKNLKLSGEIYNPALAIIQSVFDRADPINYARDVWRNPTAAVPQGHHLFMTYGLGDSYAPEPTQRAYARAAGLTQVQPVLVELNLPQAPAPLSDNLGVGGAPRTIGVRQYKPSADVDGHFVGVDQGEAGRPDVERFLNQLLDGQEPAIGN
jgi:pimeloyl-ACP methyl ester carboxylesterase